MRKVQYQVLVGFVAVAVLLLPAGYHSPRAQPKAGTGVAFSPVRIGSAQGAVMGGPSVVEGSGDLYASVSIDGPPKQFALYWLNEGVAKPLIDSAGKQVQVRYFQIVGSGGVNFLITGEAKKSVLRLDRDKATQVVTADGKALVVNDGPEVVVEGSRVFLKNPGIGMPEHWIWSLEGAKATRFALPADLPKTKYLDLIPAGGETYLRDRYTLGSAEPGRLWRLHDGKLERVTYFEGEPADIYWSVAVALGGRTYYSMQDPETEAFFLWQLKKAELEPVLDGEGDHLQLPGLVSFAAVGSTIFSPGYVRDSDSTHVWVLGADGKAKLLTHGGKPFTAQRISATAAGACAILEVERAGTEDCEYWLTSGSTCVPLKTPDGKPLRGNVYSRPAGQEILIQHEGKDGRYTLLLASANGETTAAVDSGGKPLVGGARETWHMFASGGYAYAYSSDLMKPPGTLYAAKLRK